MKALILSCSIGGGHNACASAIKEEFETHGDYCEIADALEFIQPGISSRFSRIHERVYRYAPALFNGSYRFGETHPGVFKKDSQIYKLFEKGSGFLCDYITYMGFDTVICTHVFSAYLVTVTKNYYKMDPLTCFVATDYTSSPSMNESELDIYFIPDESIADVFVSEKITRDKIVASGIPVRKMFYGSIPKSLAKKKEGIPEDAGHLVMMCGSMGCGPMKKICEDISRQLGKNEYLTVVCGTNGRLYDELLRLAEKDGAAFENVHIKRYVSDVAALLDSADLYITKPGGISTTEAAVKRVPMVLVNAVAGCESYNMQFFLKLGCAVTADGADTLADVCIKTLRDRDKLCKMKAAYDSFKVTRGAGTIYETLDSEYI